MAEIRKAASVAPRTVTEVSQGRHTVKRKRKPTVQKKATPVTSLSVDKRVWNEALKLSKGDARRIQAIDSETVIVHNHRRK